MSSHKLIALALCFVLAALGFSVHLAVAMPATQEDEPFKPSELDAGEQFVVLDVSEVLTASQGLVSLEPAAVIMSQNFEGAWPAAGWELEDFSTSDGGEFLWGKRTCRPRAGNNAGWSVGGGAQGGALSCSANYPNNVYTWATYGPFDLRGASSASLVFHLWGQTEGGTSCAFDYMFVGSSVNNQQFNGDRYCGNWTAGSDGNGYYRRTFDLSNRLGQSQVWVAFVLRSDVSIAYNGMTIDDVTLDVTGSMPTDTPTPFSGRQVYIPLVEYRPTPTPTPTPTATLTPLPTPTSIPTPVLPPSQAVSHWPDVAPAANGGVIVTWYDNRYGAPHYDDIFAQRFSASGTRLWTGDIWVSASDHAGDERYPAVAANGLGDNLVVWVDGTYEGGVFAQGVRNDGSRLWPTDTTVYGWPHNGKVPRVGADGAGNWYVTWKTRWDSCNNSSSCSDITVRRLGTGGWSRTVASMVFAHVYWPDIAVAPNGNSYIVWQRGSTSGDSNIFAVSLNSSGAVRWPGVVRVNSDEGTAAQGAPRITVAPSGDLFVVWADKRNGNWDIYAQRLDPNTGQRLWATDRRIDNGAPDTNQLYPELTSVDQHVYLIWADTSTGDIFGQKIDREGVKQWGNGIRINASSQWATAVYAERGPALTIGIDGNLYIVWQGLRNNQYDIFLQSYTPTGTRRWATDVVVEG